MSEIKLHRAEYRRVYKAAGAVVSLLAAVGAGIGIGDSLFSSNSATSAHTRLALGVVECSDNQAVEGVWVAAGSSSGWATFESTVSANVATFQRDSIRQGSYTVHVGCGGTPKNWATADYGTSEAATNTAAGFLCESPQGNQLTRNDRGICVQVGVTVLRAAN